MAGPCSCPDQLTCGCLLTAGSATQVAGNGSVDSPYVISSTAYQQIEDEGVALPTQDTLNFIGLAVTATDDAGNFRTNVTIDTAATDFVRKTTTEPLTSSTALQDDDELFLSVAANATYKFVLHLVIDGSTAGDFKMDFTVPAGATTVWGEAFTGPGFLTASGVSTRQTLGAGTHSSVHVEGTLVTAGTAGTLQLRWAQNTSDGTPTRVFFGSSLKTERYA